MCGIVVVFGVYRGSESIRDRVLERVRRIRHRGPDWSGVYCKGHTIMAHERLSIVDVSSGSQPLFTEQKDCVLAVNGEIYNHLNVREEMESKGYNGRFMTKSDCEIILHLYKQGGMANVCSRVNGMFAFAMYDEAKDEYMIARDHAGIIPLYWGHDCDGALWVSSELKGLHDVCVTFSDFPPGHYYDSSTKSLVKWYNPIWHTPEYMPTASVDLDVLRNQLEDSVKRHLMSDVPYGVLLSGGLDSSLISAIAARVCAKRVESGCSEEAWWPRLHSFSIGLEGSPDLAAAAKVAKHIKSVHHEIKFTIDEGLNAYRDVIYHLETYDITTIRAATPMYLMSRYIRAQGVKMVLSGEGADEVFAGYLYFHKCPNKEEMQEELVRKVKGLYKFDCLRANKATAAWGVEARVPFLDREFLDYALDIDPADKMCGVNGGGRIEKHILRKAFEGYLPDDILWRQKEQFSDGVGYSWIDSIRARAGDLVSDTDLANAKYRFPINPPQTKEAYYIRQTFHSFFPQNSAAETVPGGPSVACSSATAIKWDENFKKMADCSGRSVAGVHVAAYSDSQRAAATAAVSDKDVEGANLTFCTTFTDDAVAAPSSKKAKV